MNQKQTCEQEWNQDGWVSEDHLLQCPECQEKLTCLQKLQKALASPPAFPENLESVILQHVYVQANRSKRDIQFLRAYIAVFSLFLIGLIAFWENFLHIFTFSFSPQLFIFSDSLLAYVDFSWLYWILPYFPDFSFFFQISPSFPPYFSPYQQTFWTILGLLCLISSFIWIYYIKYRWKGASKMKNKLSSHFFFFLIIFLCTHPVFATGYEKKMVEIIAMGSLVSMGFIAILVLSLVLFSLQIFGYLFFPNLAQKSLKVSSFTPFRCSFLGLLNTLGMAFIVILLGSLKHPITILLALIIMAIFCFVFLLGLIGASLYLGNRVLQPGIEKKNSFSTLVVGWLLLYSLLLIPLVGWILLAYYSFLGLGGTMLALFHVEPTS